MDRINIEKHADIFALGLVQAGYIEEVKSYRFE
jgi:hypothetical protein